MITYTKTKKLDINFDGMDEQMKKMIPQSESLEMELTFIKEQSLFQNKKGESLEDLDMESDDGSMKITFIREDQVENILHKNLDRNIRTHQKGIMGKPFLIVDDLKNLQWKITSEKVKYLGYECQKAVIENEDEFVVAWYTPSIPVQHGPSSYYGLPGLILMLSINDGDTEFKANAVELMELGELQVKAPNKGKKVNQVQYDKIETDKINELKEMYSKKKSKNK